MNSMFYVATEILWFTFWQLLIMQYNTFLDRARKKQTEILQSLFSLWLYGCFLYLFLKPQYSKHAKKKAKSRHILCFVHLKYIILTLQNIILYFCKVNNSLVMHNKIKTVTTIVINKYINTTITFFLEVTEKSHSKVGHFTKMYKLTFPCVAYTNLWGYYFLSRW